MLDLCFVLQYSVSSLVLQSSCWGRESWLLYFCCVLHVMSLLSFFDSSLQYHELVYTIVKPVLSDHINIDKTKGLMEYGSLMKVESIAEYSPWSILQYF